MGCLFPCFRRNKKENPEQESLLSDGLAPGNDEESKLSEEQEFMNTSSADAKIIPIKNDNDKVSYPQKVSVTDFIFLKVKHLLNTVRNSDRY